MEEFKISKLLSRLVVVLLAGILIVASMAVKHLVVDKIVSEIEADGKGHFRDIKNWYGAVTGTTYENADEEISVNITVSSSDIVLDIYFRCPDKFPYRELEELGLKEYQVIGPDGRVVCAETKVVQYSNISDGKTSFQICFGDIPDGEYKLQILSFEGLNAPEHPLVINGKWESKFLI